MVGGWVVGGGHQRLSCGEGGGHVLFCFRVITGYQYKPNGNPGIVVYMMGMGSGYGVGLLRARFAIFTVNDWERGFHLPVFFWV
jgi:hypothetical protein